MQRLIFYSEHARELQGSTAAKISAILAQDAIEYSRERKAWICKPILQGDGRPYNSTTYEMKGHKTFSWSCSCQGWVMKLRKHEADPLHQPAPSCSHVAALWEVLKRRNMALRETRVRQAMLAVFE